MKIDEVDYFMGVRARPKSLEITQRQLLLGAAVVLTLSLLDAFDWKLAWVAGALALVTVSGLLFALRER